MTAEQQARELLDRIGVPDAQSYSAGDLVELANLLAFAPTWQPIETAPKDGTQILLYRRRGEWALYDAGRWQKEEADEESFWSWRWGYEPTHWMQLPTPPVDSASAGAIIPASPSDRSCSPR